MKRTANGVLLGLIALIIALPVQGYPLSSPAAHAPAVDADGVQILRSDEDAVVLDIRVPAAALENVTVEGGAYRTVTIPGYAAAGEPGQPDLPARGWMIGIPPGARAGVRVTASEVVTLDGVSVPPAAREVPDLSGWDGSRPAEEPPVTLDYSPDPAIYLQDAFWPPEQAALDAPASLRDLATVVVRAYPVQYNPARGQARVAGRLRVEIAFSYPDGRRAARPRPEAELWLQQMRSAVLNWDTAQNWLAAPAAAAPGISGPETGEVFRIGVKQDGLYQVTYNELSALGLPAGLATSALRLRDASGTELRIRVIDGGTANVFDSGDAFVFWGQEVRGNKYSRVNAYWLSTDGAPGLRMQEVSAPSGAGTTPAAYTQTLHLEQNHLYRSSVPGSDATDHWYWDQLDSSHTWYSYPVTLTHYATGTNAALRLQFYAFTTNNAVQVFWNGTRVISTTWMGQIAPVLTATVSVTATQNILMILNPGRIETVHFDYHETEYRHAYIADSDRLLYRPDATGTWKYAVGGLTQAGAFAEVYNVADPANVTYYYGGSSVFDPGNNWWVYTFQPPAATGPSDRFLVQNSNTARLTPYSLARDATSDLKSNLAQTDYILLVADSLADTVTPLANARRARPCAGGTRPCTVRVVKVQDVYDEFGGGVMSAGAIKDFLAWAYANWTAPAPSHVLLFGDGTFDPQGYCLNAGWCAGFTGQVTGIPPYLTAADSHAVETDADHCYVASGPCGLFTDHSLPFMHLGRIPAANTTEATTAVNKLVAYERPPTASWRWTALNTCDNGIDEYGVPDPAGNFYVNCIDYTAVLTATSMIVDCDYYSKNPSYQGGCYYYNAPSEPPDNFTNHMVDSLNAGAVMATYTGHASIQFLGAEHLWDLSDVDRLTNATRPTFWYPMTCLEGQYDRPSMASLAEKMLFATNGGSIGSYSPVGLDVVTGHEYLREGLTNAIFTDNVRSMGGLADAGKIGLWTQAPTIYRNLLETYMLIGDPAANLALIDRPTLTNIVELPASMFNAVQ